MKKLVLAAILGLGVFGMLGVASLNAAEIFSAGQLMQLFDDCHNKQNKIACQSFIDNNLYQSVEECDKSTCDGYGDIFYFTANYQQAVKYYQKSADLGNARGYHLLGLLYYDGKGVCQNLPKAFTLYKKACDLNFATACHNVGLLYDNGRGVKQDFTNARKYYEKACNANIAGACNNLGYLYGNGKGVKENLSTAKQYYGKACDLGNQMGCDNYKILNKQGVK